MSSAGIPRSNTRVDGSLVSFRTGSNSGDFSFSSGVCLLMWHRQGAAACGPRCVQLLDVQFQGVESVQGARDEGRGARILVLGPLDRSCCPPCLRNPATRECAQCLW